MNNLQAWGVATKRGLLYKAGVDETLLRTSFSPLKRPCKVKCRVYCCGRSQCITLFREKGLWQ